jgi:prepilin-type N-terminal cleavage/methylation domain-containing protein
MNSRSSAGFSLFEWMIAAAVIGIVSALAVPAYRGYIETANMTKVTANFEQGVRIAQNTFAKDKTRVTIGLPATAPNHTDGWIELLNRSGVQAPGGGPAYIPSTNNKTSGRGDAEKGAVDVQWRAERSAKTRKNRKVSLAREARLTLWRPLYLSLVE